MARFAYRRRRFGRGAAAVTQSTTVLKRKAKCRACGGHLSKGDTVTRLRLKKKHQVPCGSCGHKPAKLKYYHTACTPADINKAMGYDPAAASQYVPPPPSSSQHQVPPPPKPLTPEEAQLIAINATIEAVKARCRNNPKIQAQLAPDFKTFSGLTARALRPGTPEEGVVAMKFALKRAIDLAFNN